MEKLQPKPLIAIITNPYPEDDDSTKISTISCSYYLWLKDLGAQIIFLPWNTNFKDASKVIECLNGVLFQGGGRDFILNGLYERTFLWVINECDKNKIPIWFTCQGFQFLHCLLAGENLLGKFKARWVLLSHQLRTKEIKSSKMFGNFTDDDVNLCNNKDTPCFVHNNGLGFNELIYNKYSVIRENLIINSTAKDLNGKDFITAVESRDFSKNKYFAVQFHPEKAKYSANKDFSNDNTITINTKLGKCFIDEAILTMKFQNTLNNKLLDLLLIKENFPSHKTSFNEYFFFKDFSIINFKGN